MPRLFIEVGQIPIEFCAGRTTSFVVTNNRGGAGMSDEQAISAVVHLYVDGMAFANEGALRKAFHPDAAIIGNYRGALEWMTRDGFIKAVLDQGGAPPGTQPEMDVEMTDIAGDAATVKVIDSFAGERFSDYLSLVKIDGRWVIVNKIYHLHG